MAVLRTGDSRLVPVDPQAQAPFDELGHAGHPPLPGPFAFDVDVAVSRREGSHLPALAEPDVNLSAHPSPIVQPSGRSPQRQCANRPGWRRATSAMNLCALVLWRRKRLYFRMAHLTSVSLKWRKTGYNMDL